MKKGKTFLSLLLLIAGTAWGSPDVQASYWSNACPTSSQLGGWWGSIAPTYRLCSQDYYTWNSTGPEESYFKGYQIALMCSYQPWQNPGYTGSRVYVPWPDSKQTTNARYYKWNSSTYVMIGSVNQYNSFGWVYLNSLDWGQGDQLKLSDITLNEARYTKHVDLDAYGVSCNN